MTDEPSFTELTARECCWVIQSNAAEMLAALDLQEHAGDSECMALREVWEAARRLEEVLRQPVAFYEAGGFFPGGR